MKLEDYSLAVIASHNVMNFLNLLIESLKYFNFDFSQFYLGDAGLNKEDIEILKRKVDPHIIDLPKKDHGEFRTQSVNYRRVIDNRIMFLNKVYDKTKGKSILQLDADTYIVKSDFSLIDVGADLTLTVRSAPSHLAISEFEKYHRHYPNLGVVFWNNPLNCKELWQELEKLRSVVAPSDHQYEQNIFFHGMESSVFKKLEVQEIECKYYNCYNVDWLGYEPAIIHFKNGRMGRDGKGNPNSELLNYCRRLKKVNNENEL